MSQMIISRLNTSPGTTRFSTSQIVVFCKRCGGPWFLSEEKLAADKGEFVHKDPSVCECILRNAASRLPHSPTHPLDTPSNQKIGNSVILQPQLTGATVIPPNPECLLDLNGPPRTGQIISVILAASRLTDPKNPEPGYPGPITGVIEFGNEGQYTMAEVDVPIGSHARHPFCTASSSKSQDGGTIISMPAGFLRVWVRYDNAFIQPQVNHMGLSLAQSNEVPFMGPGGPVNTPDSRNPILAEPVQVKAMAAYYAKQNSKVYRTHYLYIADRSVGSQIPISVTGASFCVPPFAQSLKVLRSPITARFTLSLCDNSGHELDILKVPSGSAPIIPLVGTESIITIDFTSQITLLAFCYEIGI